MAAIHAPNYLGSITVPMDGDLLRVSVRMSGVRDVEDIKTYATCTAAARALEAGYGFARHLRTNTAMEGGVWLADAVYSVSKALPPGLSTIDAEVIAANCKDTGIPTE